MEQKEFQIKSLKGFTFRPGKIKPTEYLTLNSMVDFKNFQKTESIFNFILEHLEVNVANKWVKVKEDEIFMPVSLNDNYVALEELCYYFLHEILIPLFTESKE